LRRSIESAMVNLRSLLVRINNKMNLSVLSVSPTGVESEPVTIGVVRLSVVIDFLRASSSIATAIASVEKVLVGRDPESAREISARHGPATLLVGERNAVPLAGFHLGNSPLELTRERVAGKTIVLTTTNGTKALLAAAPNCRDVLIGSYVNFTVALAAVRSALRQGLDVDIVCAGSEGKFSLEDTAYTGRFVRFAMRRPGYAGPPS
jgi:2-phosphosulfolactate phosphatase